MTRRLARSVVCPTTLLAVFLAVCLAACDTGPRRTDFAFATMGTVARCDLALPAGLDEAGARRLVAAVCDSVNAVLNSWDPASELARLNAAPAGARVPVSPWLAACLGAAGRLHTASGGAFDPTAVPLTDLWRATSVEGRLPRPAELDSARALLGGWRLEDFRVVVKSAAEVRFDLGGIAKGLAVDLATSALEDAGVHDGLIDLGGNQFCLGGAPGREDWRVAVRDPQDHSRHFATIVLRDLAVSTSGDSGGLVTIDGRRYGNVMNPASGRPAEGLLAATAVAPSAMLADGLATTLYVLGETGARRLLAELAEPAEAVLVVPGGSDGRAVVLVTPGLRHRFSLLPEAADRYELRAWD